MLETALGASTAEITLSCSAMPSSGADETRDGVPDLLGQCSFADLRPVIPKHFLSQVTVLRSLLSQYWLPIASSKTCNLYLNNERKI